MHSVVLTVYSYINTGFPGDMSTVTDMNIEGYAQWV